MNTIKVNHGETKMVAHRGVSGLERENTCAAFVAAGSRSYFGIETDVHRTGDGKYIIIHDDATTRVTGRELVVEETDFATLRTLPLFDRETELPRSDLSLPPLEDYLSICKKYEKIAVLELKKAMDRETVLGIAGAVAQSGWMEHTIFISFEWDNLMFLREGYPDQNAQYLVSRIEDPQALAAQLKEHRLDLDAKHIVVTKEIVSLMHENGIQVNVWTVDDPARARELVDMGVDYITSNILE